MYWITQQKAEIETKSYLNFYSYDGRFNLYLSSNFRKHIKERSYTHLQLGVDKEKGLIGVKLNNNGDGVSLKTPKGVYRKQIVITTSFKCLQHHIPSVKCDFRYDLERVDDSYFIVKLDKFGYIKKER